MVDGWDNGYLPPQPQRGGRGEWRAKTIDFGKKQARKAFDVAGEKAQDLGRNAAVGAGSKLIEVAWASLCGLGGLAQEKRRLVSTVRDLGDELVGACQAYDGKMSLLKAKFQVQARAAHESRWTSEDKKLILADLDSLAEETVRFVLENPWVEGMAPPPTVMNAIEKFRMRLIDLQS